MSSSTLTLYCNGIFNTQKSAENQCVEIGKFLNRKVELHYNDSTELNSLIVPALISAGGICGAIFCGYKLYNDKDKNRWYAVGLVACLITAIATIIICYNKIQERKEELAEKLADRVITHLSSNPLNTVMLILHSQGTDIGLRALEKIQTQERFRDICSMLVSDSFVNRIAVTTFGGMRQIPSHLARNIKNIAEITDPVSNFLGHHSLPSHEQAVRICKIEQPAEVCSDVFGLTANNYTIYKQEDCKTNFCHGMKDYLSVPKNIQTLVLQAFELETINAGATS